MKTATKTAQPDLLGGAEVLPPRKPTKKTEVAVREKGQQPASLTEFEQTISMFERAIRDPAVDVSKAREIRAMMKELETERAEGMFNEAMAMAQSEIGMVAVDRKNDQTKSRYASYPALDRAIRPVYSKHGFALSFDTEDGAPPDCVRVVCFVSCCRHTRKYKITMPADGKGAKGGDVMTRTHAAGSAVSYGMRYLLKMIFNIPTGEDDDGNKAGKVAKNVVADEVLISKQQMTTLIEAIEWCGVGVQKFCEHFEIEKIPDLPASSFDDAMTACKNYAAKKKEKANG